MCGQTLVEATTSLYSETLQADRHALSAGTPQRSSQENHTSRNSSRHGPSGRGEGSVLRTCLGARGDPAPTVSISHLSTRMNVPRPYDLLSFVLICQQTLDGLDGEQRP